MYLFEHLLLRLDWPPIGAPAPSRAPRLPGHPRRRPGPPADRRLVGARAVDLAGDGCPLPNGARARPTASLGPVRTSRDAPGHAPQAPAHSLSVPPAHACPARPARTSPSGSGHPSGPMALREGARPQDPRDRPCDPSPSCPSHARCVPPHLGHAPGSPPALPSPSGTCARRGPVSLPLSPCARPPRLSRHHARHPASLLDMSSRGQHRSGDAGRRHADGGLTESCVYLSSKNEPWRARNCIPPYLSAVSRW